MKISDLIEEYINEIIHVRADRGLRPRRGHGCQ